MYVFAREVFTAWHEDKSLHLGAALGFYTIFAISPLFLIVLTVASIWYGEDAAREHLFAQLRSLLGSAGAEAVQAVIASANYSKPGSWTIAALGALLLGATGVFVELQDDLNTIWRVQKLPGGSIRRFIKDRVLSFAMVLSIGFLLLVSLVISAALTAFGTYLGGWLPMVKTFWQAVDVLLSFVVVAALFALILKLLPDVHIPWRDVWAGAVLSSLLFNLGKFLLGFYLGHSSVASTHGAAGSLVLIVLWVYYSSQTLFLGAEFTRILAGKLNHRVEPKAHAKILPECQPASAG